MAKKQPKKSKRRLEAEALHRVLVSMKWPSEKRAPRSS
jgi:hypothetical protein